MTKKKARVFIPLTKVDEEQRLVYGRITQEVLDKSGEVMDYDSSKPLFEKWSGEISDASGGLSKGNVRVMHGLTVAGKLTDIDFNDDEKAIDVCSKVVDDAEWDKVTEGCYTGFSVGGSYAKRWTDTDPDTKEKVKKFTAQPNEVSLVDNPCVPSATFAMMKADGAQEDVSFQVENDDEAWPDFAKADTADDKAEEIKEETSAEEVKKAEDTPSTSVPSNEEVAAKAEEMAKAADDGSTWMDHVSAASEELSKADDKSAEVIADEEASEEEDKVEKTDKVTPAGVKQKWTTSDGKAFDKKADAEQHEEELQKAEPTESDKLKSRLDKALSDDPEDTGLMEDWDRMGKVYQALETPFIDGSPKLEKGMYTVSRFANLMWDLGSIIRKIAKEGAVEGEESEQQISEDMKSALVSLTDCFRDYVDQQLTDLVAGIDDDVCVEVYDYYYAAAKDNSEDQLAKDVCSVLQDRRDPSRERREELAKAFGIEQEEDTSEEGEELNPTMQKRFDALESENTDLKKIAEDAVTAVEELTKRVDGIEDTPLPRAPRNIIPHGGDGNFLGKAAETEEEKIAVLHDMIKNKGPDALAIELIKAAQSSGGQQLHLNK